MQIYAMEQRQRLYFIQPKFIIECLPHFDKLALSQFKIYIEVKTMTHCYVCDNFQKIIFIQSPKVKEVLFYFIDVKDTYWFAKVE